MIAFYQGEAVDGYGSTSIWYSVGNDAVFAICWTDVRHKPVTWLEYLHKKACQNKTSASREGLEVTACKLVECNCLAPLTMKTFLDVKNKTGGQGRNSCSKVEVQSKSDVRIPEANFEDQERIVPLLLRARMLDANEFIPTDFQTKQTISEIVAELGGCNKSLNDLPGDAILKAIRKFSDHCHSVTLDEPALPNSTTLIEAIVDFDSGSAVYTKRDEGRKKDIAEILLELNEFLGKSQHGNCESPRFMGLSKGVWFSGFNSCTSYTPNNFMAFSSKCKGGPTVQTCPNVNVWRVQLPVPIGQEVFKIWVYSPPKLTQADFLKSIELIAGKCAIKLMHQYDFHLQMDALQSTLDNDVKGGRPSQIPGGIKFPLSIALMFLEDNSEGSFAVETYGCKSKGARFTMKTDDFGTEIWVDRLVKIMKDWMRLNDSMIKTFCHLDRIANMNPQLSRVGIGFEFRFVITFNTLTNTHEFVH